MGGEQKGTHPDDDVGGDISHREVKSEKRKTFGLFSNPVVISRWGLFFKGYKPSKYYWECVYALRKVSVVALSVFGKDLGVLRQSVMALWIILMCIIFELVGEPWREITRAHKVLRRLEIGTLSVVWGTFWAGLMIHLSGPRSRVSNMVID